jgi:HK97 family phage portal protein
VGRLKRAVQALTRADPDNGPLQPSIDSFWADLRGTGLPHRVAEKIGAASRALQLTSQILGALEPEIEGGGRRPAWVDNPDPGWFTTFGEALAAASYQYYRFGDAILYATSRYGADGPVRNWTVLDTVTCSIRTRNGLRTYESNGVELNPRNVLQVSRQSPVFPAVRSQGAFEAYWSNMNSAVASDNLTAGTFSGMGIPQAILKIVSGTHNAKMARELQADWMASVARRYGAPAVLPPNVEFSKLSWSPKELMLLELREFDTRAIASALGVPAMLLNVPVAGGLTYQNPAALFDFWWRSELRVTAVKFQQALSSWGTTRPQRFVLNPGGLLQPDFAEYATAMLTALERKAVTSDEVRTKALGLQPLPDGAGASIDPGSVLPAIEDQDRPQVDQLDGSRS